MDFSLKNSIEVLQSTPLVLQTQLGDLSLDWTSPNEGGETWSVFDVIGHLIHGEETDWIPRMEIILGNGNKQFEPFDRFAQVEKSKGKNLHQLLAEFKIKREGNIKILLSKNLNNELLDKTGIHPAFGEVNLRQLLATWVVHDLGHIAQINRIMAKQLGNETGPWKAYLPILHPKS